MQKIKKSIVLFTLIIAILDITTNHLYAYQVKSPTLSKSNSFKDKHDESPQMGIKRMEKHIETRVFKKQVTLGGQDISISFSSPGGLFVDTNPSSTEYFSISVGYEFVSISIPVGSVSTNAVNGIFMKFPPDGKPYIVVDIMTVQVDIFEAHYYDLERNEDLGTKIETNTKVLEHDYKVIPR